MFHLHHKLQSGNALCAVAGPDHGNKNTNRIIKSGSVFSNFLLPGGSVLRKVCRARLILAATLALSLLLVGSCNERVELFDFTKKPAVVAGLAQADLVRYAFAIQTSLIQKAENISKFRAQDIRLALSTPDLERKDGAGRVWQYRTDSCVMDIFWKNNGEQREVDHYEFRARRSIFESNAPDFSNWQCVQTIIQERRNLINAGFEKSDRSDQTDLALNAHKS